MTPDLLTVTDVMARLQVGRHTVYDLIRSRRIPAAALQTYLDSLTHEDA